MRCRADPADAAAGGPAAPKATTKAACSTAGRADGWAARDASPTSKHRQLHSQAVRRPEQASRLGESERASRRPPRGQLLLQATQAEMAPDH